MSDRCFIVLTALKKLAGGKRIFDASYKDIKGFAGYGRSTVIQAISELIIAGKIVKYSGLSRGGKNQYELFE